MTMHTVTDDSDEEDIIVKHSKKVANIFDDEDSEGDIEEKSEDIHEEQDTEEKSQTNGNIVDTYTQDEDSGNRSMHEDEESSPETLSTETVTHENEKENSEGENDNEKVIRELKAKLCNDSDESDSSADERPVHENSEEDKSDHEQIGDGEEMGDEGIVDDEEDEPVVMSAKLKARLKKGASKNPAERKQTARKSKTAAMELHSETQRIVRDSRVRLPYHQPESKSLEDFLSEAREKRKLLKEIGGASAYRNCSWYEQNEQQRKLRREQKKAQQLAEEKQKQENIANNNKESTKISEDLPMTESANVSGLSFDTDVANNSDVIKLAATAAEIKTYDVKVAIKDAISDSLDVTSNSKDEDYDELPDLVVENDQGLIKSSTHVHNDNIVENMTDNCRERLFGNHKDIEENDTDNVKNREENTDDDPLVAHRLCNDDNVIDALNTNNSKDVMNNNMDNIDNKKGESFRLFLDETEMDCLSQDTENKTNSNINEAYDMTAANSEVRSKNSIIDYSENLPDWKTAMLNLDTEDVLNSTPSSEIKTLDTASAKSCSVLTNKTLLTPKLASLSIPNITPTLSGSKDGFIRLDDESDTPKQDPKLLQFVNRFLSHSTKRRKPSGGKDVTLNIVEKNIADNGDGQLRLNTLTYHSTETPSSSFGSKLDHLKQTLEINMREKREAAYKKRLEIYEMDNEVGEYGEEEEEEEAELTDEESDDDYDEEICDDIDDNGDEEKQKNEYLDDEAVDDDALDDDFDEITNDGKLRLDPSDDENMEDAEDADDEEESITVKIKKKKKMVLASDEESDSEQTSTSQTFPDDSNNNSEAIDDLDNATSITGMETNDSSDNLMSAQRPNYSHQISDGTPETEKSFSSSRNSVSNIERPGSLSLFDFSPQKTSQGDDMDELLGLCSGKFSSQPEPSISEKKTNRSLFDYYDKSDSRSKRQRLISEDSKGSRSLFSEDKTNGTLFSEESKVSTALFDDHSVTATASQDMNELLGLCSGTFAVDNSVSEEVFNLSQNRAKRKLSDDIDSAVPTEADSDLETQTPEKPKKLSRVWTMSDDDEEDEQSDQDSKSKQYTFKGFIETKGKVREDFVENEAELSGSEFGSDEDDEGEDGDEDVLDTKTADEEMRHVSEELLRNQVGRVHHKQLLDEDEREVLRLQERYLPDGDLYSENGGRQRRFRWNNMNENSQAELFDQQSDEEDNAPGENQDDSKWRMERLEREQWLAEQNKENATDEDSQFVKFGQSFVSKANSQTGTASDKKGTSSTVSMKGSLLARGKEALTTIAKMVKPANQSTVNKSGVNCVFTSKSPESEKTVKVKSSAPKKSSQEPQAKKPRLTTPHFRKPKESIFNHL